MLTIDSQTSEQLAQLGASIHISAILPPGIDESISLALAQRLFPGEEITSDGKPGSRLAFQVTLEPWQRIEVK